MREDKEPQIVINRARPMSDFENNTPAAEEFRDQVPLTGTLYLRLPTEEGKLFPKIRGILNMFPGDNRVIVYFADTGVKRGSTCALDKRMLTELVAILGDDNVVVK
jgi:hypothetical protein